MDSAHVTRDTVIVNGDPRVAMVNNRASLRERLGLTSAKNGCDHGQCGGAEGSGEIGITGTSAAIGDAVWPATGRRVRDRPITAVQAARRRTARGRRGNVRGIRGMPGTSGEPQWAAGQ
jgi:hypothetical protein